MSREIKGWQLTIGLLAVASLSANYLKGSNPELRFEKEQEFAKSGDLSFGEQVHESVVGQVLDGASKIARKFTHGVADKANAIHDLVLEFPSSRLDNPTKSESQAIINNRISDLEKYFISPWLEQEMPASLALPLVQDMFSKYGQLGDPKCSVSVYKLDRSTAQYRENQAMLESTPVHSQTIYDAKHSTNVYCLGITDVNGNTEYKFFRLYTAAVSKRQFKYRLDPCANPNCINDVRTSEDTKNSIVSSGTTYWEGGREIPLPRSNERSQSEMMRRVDEVQNANPQIQVAPLDNRNITRKENPSEDVGRGGTGGSNVSGGNIVSDCGKIDNINYDYAPAQRASGKNVCKATNGQFFIKIPRKN